MSAIKTLLLQNLQISNNKKSNEQQKQQLSSRSKRNPLPHHHHKQKSLVITTNPIECMFCQNQTTKKKAHFFPQMITRALYSKYASSQNYYYTKDINEILANSKTEVVIIHKDFVIYDEEEEYLKRFYKTNEYDYKIKMLTEYYKFHCDIARMFILPTSLILNKYHDRKRRIEYMRITKMLREENHAKSPNKKEFSPKREEDDVKSLSIQDRILDNLEFTNSSTLSQQHDEIKIYNDNINQFTNRLTKQISSTRLPLSCNLKAKSKALTPDKFYNHNENERNENENENGIKNLDDNGHQTYARPTIKAEQVLDYSREASLSNTLQDLNNKLGEIITSSLIYNFDGVYMESIDPVLTNNNNETFSNLSNFLNYLKTKPNAQGFLNTRPSATITKDNNINNNILHVENLQEVNPNFFQPPTSIYPKPVLKASQSVPNNLRQTNDRPGSVISNNNDPISTPTHMIQSRKNSQENILMSYPTVSQGGSPSNDHYGKVLNDRYDHDKNVPNQNLILPEPIKKNLKEIPAIKKASSSTQLSKTKSLMKIKLFEEALAGRDRDNGFGTQDSQRSHKSLSRENSQKKIINVPSVLPQKQAVIVKTPKDDLRSTSSSKFMNSTLKQGVTLRNSVNMKTHTTDFSNFHQKSKSISISNNKTSNSTMTPSLINTKYTVKSSTNTVNPLMKKESVEREKMTSIMKRVEGVINEQKLKVNHSKVNFGTAMNQKLTPTTSSNLGLDTKYAIVNPIFANNKSQLQQQPQQFTLVDRGGITPINVGNQFTKTKTSFLMKPTVKNELYQVPNPQLFKKADHSASISTGINTNTNNQDMNIISNMTKTSNINNGFSHISTDNYKQQSGLKHTKSDVKLIKDDINTKERSILGANSDIFSRTHQGNFSKYANNDKKDKITSPITKLGGTQQAPIGNENILNPVSKKQRASLPHNPSVYTYNHNSIVNIFLNNENNKKKMKINQQSPSPFLKEKSALHDNENQQLSANTSTITNKAVVVPKASKTYSAMHSQSICLN